MLLTATVSCSIASVIAAIAVEEVNATPDLQGWSRKQLADKAKVSRTSVVVFKAGERHQSHWIVDAIQDALEANVVFFDQGGGECPIARLTKSI
jgi:hypothetical protein